jgi:hypothetical protein
MGLLCWLKSSRAGRSRGNGRVGVAGRTGADDRDWPLGAGGAQAHGVEAAERLAGDRRRLIDAQGVEAGNRGV